MIVCAGNTCRSAMARVVIQQMALAKGMSQQFKVDSAACLGPSGSTAHPNAVQAIKVTFGEDLLASHVPKKLTQKMVAEADVIMVMQDSMKAGMPQNKVLVLNIEDPYGHGIEEYKKCLKTIQHRLEEVWPKITSGTFAA